jgi:hypothetical protein
VWVAVVDGLVEETPGCGGRRSFDGAAGFVWVRVLKWFVAVVREL